VRLEYCHFRNMGTLVDWTLDLRPLAEDDKLVALTGANGRGKSTCLELSILGAAYLNTPTVGSVARRARGADSLLESGIVHAGRRWKIRHLIDAIEGTTKCVVIGEDGEPVFKKAGPKEFKRWAEDNLPQRSVVESSLFRFQTSEGFVQMDSAPRIAVLLRVIGVERLERKAKLAREKADAEEKRLNEILRRIEDIRGSDPGVQEREAAAAAARASASAAEVSAAEARAGLASRREEAAAHALRAASRKAADELAATLREQVTSAKARRAHAEIRLAGNRTFQAQAASIRAAAAGLEAANAELTRLELALADADKAIRAELDPWRDAPVRHKAALQRAVGAATRMKDEAAVLAAVGAKTKLSDDAEAERIVVAALSAEIEALTAHRIAGVDERLSFSLNGHSRIRALAPDELEQGPAISGICIDGDAELSRVAIETPRQLAELKAKLAREQAHLAAAEQALLAAEKLAARADDLDAARADKAAAEKEAADIRQMHALSALLAFVRAIGRLGTARAARAAAQQLAETRTLAGRLPALEDSDRRIGELVMEVAAADEEIAKVESRLATIDLVEVGAEPRVAEALAAVAAAESTERSAAAALVQAEVALAASREVAGKLEQLEAERADAEAELTDWTRLALDYGRTGMQSDEVDAAGPELTGYVNGALRACVGTRWTVRVETQKLDAKGKELVDKLVIMVLDSKTGEEREVREHSGGERTALAEGLGAGLVMLACSRAGFERPTIVRDESANFLDENTAPLWIKMMRHVVKYTNADRLLFVSHNPAVRALADKQIEIPDQLSGFAASASEAA
jgi:exonuclease SbcC